MIRCWRLLQRWIDDVVGGSNDVAEIADAAQIVAVGAEGLDGFLETKHVSFGL